MTLITSAANSSINNDSMEKKLETYRKQGKTFPQMSEIVENYDLPSNAEERWAFESITSNNLTCIEKRGKKLSEAAFEIWKDY